MQGWLVRGRAMRRCRRLWKGRYLTAFLTLIPSNWSVGRQNSTAVEGREVCECARCSAHPTLQLACPNNKQSQARNAGGPAAIESAAWQRTLRQRE